MNLVTVKGVEAPPAPGKNLTKIIYIRGPEMSITNVSEMMNIFVPNVVVKPSPPLIITTEMETITSHLRDFPHLAQ